MRYDLLEANERYYYIAHLTYGVRIDLKRLGMPNGLPREKYVVRVDDQFVVWYPSGEVTSRRFSCR